MCTVSIVVVGVHTGGGGGGEGGESGGEEGSLARHCSTMHIVLK